MTTFLFWNLNKKPLEQEVLELVQEHQVDVLMLAESEIADTQLLTSLNQRIGAGTKYHQNSYIPTSVISTRVKLFSKISPKEVRSVSKWAIYELQFSQISILVAVAHLPSKSHMGEPGQEIEIRKLSDAIKEAEKQVSHNNTVFSRGFKYEPF